MKGLKVVFTAALLAASSLTLAAGYDCTNSPPSAYPGAHFGNSQWGDCYLDSAVLNCKAGQMINPPSGCPITDINNSIHVVKNKTMAQLGCTEMEHKGYISKAGYDQCVSDLVEFSKNCTCATADCKKTQLDDPTPVANVTCGS